MARIDGRPKREKLAAVLAADMTGVTAASEASGIPESTIRYWAQKPEFAEFRAKAREEMQEGVTVVAHLAWMRIAEALKAGTMEPRDALFAADKATNLLLLMSGEATSRTESTTLTYDISPDKRAALRDWIMALPAGADQEPAPH